MKLYICEWETHKGTHCPEICMSNCAWLQPSRWNGRMVVGIPAFSIGRREEEDRWVGRLSHRHTTGSQFASIEALLPTSCPAPSLLSSRDICLRSVHCLLDYGYSQPQNSWVLSWRNQSINCICFPAQRHLGSQEQRNTRESHHVLCLTNEIYWTDKKNVSCPWTGREIIVGLAKRWVFIGSLEHEQWKSTARLETLFAY